MKKIFFATVSALTIIGIGFFAVYFINSRNSSSTGGAPITVGDFLHTNPFGANDSSSTTTQASPVQTTATETSTADSGANPSAKIFSNQNLRQISSVPVSGAVFVKNKNIQSVRFIERATGRVYETSLPSFETKRLTNTTIPKIYEAYWTEAGNSFVGRYLSDDNETVKNFSAKIISAVTSTGSGTLKSSPISAEINSLAISPSGTKIFSIQPAGNGVSGVISNPDSTKATSIFDSPASEWLAFWPKSDTIILATKPSASSMGYSFSLNATTGKLSSLVGATGLTVLPSPDASKILYSETNQGVPFMSIYTAKTASSVSLSNAGLPEKCVWTSDSARIYCGISATIKKSAYPDNWYKGVVSFEDDVYEISPKTGIGRKIGDLKSLASSQKIDIQNPQISPDGNYFIFTNKNDLTLWVLKISS